MKKRMIPLMLAAALIMSVSSCGATNSSGGGATTRAPSINGGADSSPVKDYGESADSYDRSESSDSSDSHDSYDSYESTDEAYPDYAAGSEKGAGLLTAGEWRDNSNFAFWKSLFDQRREWTSEISHWNISALERVFVRVKTGETPAAGLEVSLCAGSSVLWQAVTDSRGEAFLFTDITHAQRTPDKISVRIPSGGTVVSALPPDCIGSNLPVEIDIPEYAPMRTELDLMFMVDTTGSMGDELSYLQTELRDVIRRVYNETQADIQLSVNFYRDIGDDYVVRPFAFTGNIDSAIIDLSAQKAEGGGDRPEAVTNALNNGINLHSWRSGSEKLMFLVLDAPPHRNDGVNELGNLLKAAASKGIRIIPVASSGVDTDTEFLCRVMAAATGGTYTFLTDDSGIGNSHLEPTVGGYTVERLNDMLVRVISEYFSTEPRGTQKTEWTPPEYMTSAQTSWYKTERYYDGEGCYTAGELKSTNEINAFLDKYGIGQDSGLYIPELSGNGDKIMYEVICLTSKQIELDEKYGLSLVPDENGRLLFDYRLTGSAAGADGAATLFLFARLPG